MRSFLLEDYPTALYQFMTVFPAFKKDYSVKWSAPPMILGTQAVASVCNGYTLYVLVTPLKPCWSLQVCTSKAMSLAGGSKPGCSTNPAHELKVRSISMPKICAFLQALWWSSSTFLNLSTLAIGIR